MPTFSELFKRHGLRMYGSVLLGNLAVTTIFYVVAMIIAIPVIILLAFLFAASFDSVDPTSLEDLDAMMASGALGGIIIAGLVIFLLFMVLASLSNAFLQAGTISVTIEPILEGNSNISTFFVQGFKKMWKVFLLNLLILFVPSIPITILTFVTIFSFATETTFGIIIGVFLALITLFLSGLCYLLFFHASIILVAENAGVIDSIKASIKLFKSQFGRVFGSSFYYFSIYYLFYHLGSVLVVLLISFLIDGEGSLEGIFGGSDTTTFDLVNGLHSLLINWWAAPFVLTVVTLLVTLRYYKYLRPTLNLTPLDPNGGSNQTHFGLKKSSSIENSFKTYDNSDKPKSFSRSIEDSDDDSLEESPKKDEMSTSETQNKPSDEPTWGFRNDSSANSHSSSSDHESKATWDFKDSFDNRSGYKDDSSSNSHSNNDSGSSSD